MAEQEAAANTATELEEEEEEGEELKAEDGGMAGVHLMEEGEGGGKANSDSGEASE